MPCMYILVTDTMLCSLSIQQAASFAHAGPLVGLDHMVANQHIVCACSKFNVLRVYRRVEARVE